jgi:hypothetical protein
MQVVLEGGDDPEVATAAPQSPEQVRFRFPVDVEAVAVGGDQVGGTQVVDGQAVSGASGARSRRPG